MHLRRSQRQPRELDPRHLHPTRGEDRLRQSGLPMQTHLRGGAIDECTRRDFDHEDKYGNAYTESCRVCTQPDGTQNIGDCRVKPD